MSNYPYQQPQPPQYAPPRPSSTMAVVSMIAGILGFVQILPGIGPIVAIITGHMAKSEIKNSGGIMSGDGMATTGLVLGYGTLGIGLCVICLFFVVFPLLGFSLWGLTGSGGY